MCLILLAVVAASAQGIRSTGASPAPRATPSKKAFPVSLVNVNIQAGLNVPITSGNETRKRYVVEANGSGVALLDYNNDGLLDVFLVNGSKLELTQPPGNYLFKNAGGGRFENVTTPSKIGRGGWGNGVCAGDYDNDGNTDLYVTYWGPNALLRNAGNGTFIDAALKAGVAGPPKEWSTGCTFIDFDRDGHLDLFVASYLEFDRTKVPEPGARQYCLWKGAPVFCGPRGLPYGTATLYRNRANGTFEDVSIKSGIRAAKDFYAFTATSADFDGDGWQDIYVACDSTASLFFRNNRDGTFREVGVEAGLAYNENGAEQAGMGVAAGDFNNDGHLDITKTNFSGDYPNLYRGQGKGIFDDVPMRSGLATNPQHVLWGTGFVDLDNDGLKDIVQVAGHVYPDVQRIDANDSYEQRRLVYRNLGNGRFEDVSEQAGPGVPEKFSSRGAAFGDFDNDGDIDALIMNMHRAPSLLRNDLKSANHWIKLQLQGTKSNRSAIGATVSITAGDSTQTEAIVSQTSFLSVNDFRLHFGLGAAERVQKITVRWPSGTTEEFRTSAVDTLLLLMEGSGEAKLVAMPR